MTRSGRSAAVLLIALAIVAAATLGAATDVQDDLARTRDLHGEPFAGSGACARCHPTHHESWAATFHRTMTQEATEQSVLGAFDGRLLEYGGYTASFERDAQGPLMRVRAPDGSVRVDRVVRTVGSRRYQQYLGRREGVFVRLPFAWHVEEERFFSMNEAFLLPDPPGFEAGAVAMSDLERHVTRWNDNCVFCHNVGANPGRERGPDGAEVFETEVAELGIACEACHGPGAEHVARNSSPLRRYVLHYADEMTSDPSIVSPARLSAEAQADLCGRCHGQRITDDVDSFLSRGDPFVPGDDLALYSSPLWHDTELRGVSGVFGPRFWGDGTARLTAYEYQGLLQSRCSSEGELTCTSCHGMHEGDPRGQLRPSMEGDAMCAGCHTQEASAGAAHSGHAQVACVDCHMPRIVYGIRSVHRSHRIDSPRPALDAAAGRLDACSACHSRETLAWTQAARERLFGSAPQEAPQRATPEALYAVFAGDPVQRAVAVEALGADAGPQVSLPREARAGALLDVMRHDPYPALRAIAWRALQDAFEPRAGWPSFDPSADARERAARMPALSRALPFTPRHLPARERESLAAEASRIAIEIGE